MQTTLDVKGMSCVNCEAAVKEALTETNGISAVSVDLDNGQVDVTFTESEISLEDIKGVITEAGYEVA